MLEQVGVARGTTRPAMLLVRCTRRSLSTLTRWWLKPTLRAGNWMTTMNKPVQSLTRMTINSVRTYHIKWCTPPVEDSAGSSLEPR